MPPHAVPLERLSSSSRFNFTLVEKLQGVGAPWEASGSDSLPLGLISGHSLDAVRGIGGLLNVHRKEEDSETSAFTCSSWAGESLPAPG